WPRAGPTPRRPRGPAVRDDRNGKRRPPLSGLLSSQHGVRLRVWYGHVDGPAPRARYALAKRQRQRLAEQRAACHDGVILATFSAWIDRQAIELCKHIERECAPHPARVEPLRTCRDNCRLRAR